MPVIDTELIEPLTAITDTLLKRPGVVTMQSIKKLSEMYGFTTFVEYIKSGTGTSGQNMVRLSISGLILLIDIDFSIPAEMPHTVGSPMSPSVGPSVNSIGVLPNTCIEGVSISSAIMPDKIDGNDYDFLFGFSGFPSCGDVLFSNLKERTLDSFNMNLRVLLQFDRLSKSKPDDWFTMFTELVWGLNKQALLEKQRDEKPTDEHDWANGVRGVGKVLANQSNKVGIFLQYWVDDRYTNRWIRENKGLDVVDRVYMMHFKVKESLALKGMNQFKTDRDEKESLEDDGEQNGVSSLNVDSQKGLQIGGVSDTVDDDGDVMMERDDNGSGSNADAGGDDNAGADHSAGKLGRLFDVAEGKWRTDATGSADDRRLQDNFSLVVLELCPPVWVPEDVVLLSGVDYEVINEENENWSDNYVGESNGDVALGKLYGAVNQCQGNGCVQLSTGTKVDVLVGCKMVRLFKVQLGDMNRLRELVRVLRSWSKINSVLRKMAATSESISVVLAGDGTLDEPAAGLDDIFSSADAAAPVAAAATVVTVRTSPPTIKFLRPASDGFSGPRGGEVPDGKCSDAEVELGEMFT